MNKKILLGLILGYVAYIAYKKLQSTQSNIVDSIDTPVAPGMIDFNNVV